MPVNYENVVIPPNGFTSKFLGEEKYQPLLDSIYEGLGIPKELAEEGPSQSDLMETLGVSTNDEMTGKT